jgi:hypothetical protein
VECTFEPLFLPLFFFFLELDDSPEFFFVGFPSLSDLFFFFFFLLRLDDLLLLLCFIGAAGGSGSLVFLLSSLRSSSLSSLLSSSSLRGASFRGLAVAVVLELPAAVAGASGLPAVSALAALGAVGVSSGGGIGYCGSICVGLRVLGLWSLCPCLLVVVDACGGWEGGTS